MPKNRSSGEGLLCKSLKAAEAKPLLQTWFLALFANHSLFIFFFPLSLFFVWFITSLSVWKIYTLTSTITAEFILLRSAQLLQTTKHRKLGAAHCRRADIFYPMKALIGTREESILNKS